MFMNFYNLYLSNVDVFALLYQLTTVQNYLRMGYVLEKQTVASLSKKFATCVEPEGILV
jgi:hypothetical protein